ncbi:TerD family protein [Streptomyces sp. NBS 14/10]|uniref:TerD family protein n=1 Tax=Streptomyces sp. NBS 14/10 TaxID=1945643 RepID=UPI000B7FEB81|nr:TerD family protein [Streptomyces sp. NBS 14/10]KAK1186458.1 TerD family protein [Streptomyces sp. NBS 14/10]NUS89833.1 TerD family protein [Streptomyces sp.]
MNSGKGSQVTGLNKGQSKVQVALKWDPSPLGQPAHDLDIIAGTYTAADPYGEPAYLVHFDRRSPDGTITLNRDSQTGQGLGADEVMTLELERLSPSYTRVIVGVAIQQGGGPKTFGDVTNCSFRIADGITELVNTGFVGALGAKAATIAEFIRNDSGEWQFHEGIRGFDADPDEFAGLMGRDYS